MPRTGPAGGFTPRLEGSADGAKGTLKLSFEKNRVNAQGFQAAGKSDLSTALLYRSSKRTADSRVSWPWEVRVMTVTPATSTARLISHSSGIPRAFIIPSSARRVGHRCDGARHEQPPQGNAPPPEASGCTR